MLLQGAVESPSEAFARAERFYEEQNYGEAIEVYESIRTAGVEDGVLYYNLGNAYFKAGVTGRAILSYERARKLLPGDEDVEINLRFANELVTGSIEEEPLPAAIRWAVNLYRGLGTETLARLLSAAILVGGVAMTLWLAEPGPARRSYVLAVLALAGMLALMSGSALYAKAAAERSRSDAIVLTQNAYVRSGPGEANPRLAEIHEGLKVRVLAERDDWYQVSLSNGLTGWLRRGEVEAI